MIIARTDARNAQSLGGRDAGRDAFNEGVRRLKAAVEAGADMAFMESPRTKEEMQILVKELAPHPVLINVLPDVSNGCRRYRVQETASTDKTLGTDGELDNGRMQRTRLRCCYLSLHWLHSVHASYAGLVSRIEGGGFRSEVCQG